ncbi:hypothetical protein MUK42_28788 [Musa troglodytarum]|uniref:Uncharacterized protein n=1 Tax=Musa troglodytarum TaxID=320322 RepID=A0A9E7F717_9LILI|nr:hypothetical protein MUK42_28788 [Musa troglodytarum]
MQQTGDRWRSYRSVGCWTMWRLLESKGTATTASSGTEAARPPNVFVGFTCWFKFFMRFQYPKVISRAYDDAPAWSGKYWLHSSLNQLLQVLDCLFLKFSL